MIQIARATGPSCALDALLHLPRGLVREGDREDLVRLHADRREQVRDAVGEHAGLARARAGDHEQRPLGRQHGLPLGGIQVGEVGRRLGRGHRPTVPVRSAGRARSPSHDFAAASASGSADLSTTSTCGPGRRRSSGRSRRRRPASARSPPRARTRSSTRASRSVCRQVSIGRSPRELVGVAVEHRLHLARAGRAAPTCSRSGSRARPRAGSRAAASRAGAPPSARRTRGRRGSARAGRRRARARPPAATSNAAASASRVMSSGVPPRPPVTSRWSTRSRSRRTNSTMRSVSSGTDALIATLTPSDSSRRASHEAFVFSVSPETSSFPIVKMAASTWRV